MVQTARPQMTIRRTRNSRCIPKATNTHIEYAIRFAFSTATTVARTRLSVALCVILPLLLRQQARQRAACHCFVVTDNFLKDYTDIISIKARQIHLY